MSSNPDQVDRFITEGITQMGGVDVLVNNAGISGPAGPLEDVDDDAWQQTLDVNINSQFYTCRRVIPHLKAQRSGSIVNISSTAGLFGYPMRSPYAVSKWAVVGLTKTLAMEVGRVQHPPSMPSAPAPSTTRAWSMSLPSNPRPQADLSSKSVQAIKRPFHSKLSSNPKRLPTW